MSIWTSIRDAVVKVAAPALGFAVGGPVGGAVGLALTSQPATPKAVRAALPLAPALPGIGAVIRPLVAPALRGASLLDPGVPGPGIFSPTTPPKGFHLSKQAPFHFVRNRRMNPLNPKAFRRSVRRIKGAVKFAKEVDKVVAIRPRPRRAHHDHHRHHGHH